MRLKIYQKPTCTTCKQVYNILKDSGVDMESINYYLKPLSKTKIKELLSKMNMKAKDILRTKEEIYKKLKIAEKSFTEDELIDLLCQYPDLIQRPIVEKGSKAILARPAERIKEIL